VTTLRLRGRVLVYNFRGKDRQIPTTIGFTTHVEWSASEAEGLEEDGDECMDILCCVLSRLDCLAMFGIREANANSV
jgi:hypothetical protein